MRQYILTRSAYGPCWDIEANRRRLAITAAVCARSVGAQGQRDWTWIVLMDPRDPLRDERADVFAAAAPRLKILWREIDGDRSAAAFAAYRAPWDDAIGPRNDIILQTRLDDDDGLAPHLLTRLRWWATLVGGSEGILVQPWGIRVWNGRWTSVRHPNNAMHTLVTKKGVTRGVYDYGHTKMRRVAMVYPTGGGVPAWLWVRHADTISGHRAAERPIDARVRSMFNVDWPELEAAWRAH